jgi:hypothetical protein
LDVAVKNDDHLVKLTAIVQRYISTKQTISGADGLLSDEEKQQLLKVAEATLNSELEDEIDRIQEEDVVLHQKIADAKSKLSKDVNGTT